MFEDTELSWAYVMQIAADFNTKWGFPTEKSGLAAIAEYRNPTSNNSASQGLVREEMVRVR